METELAKKQNNASASTGPDLGKWKWIWGGILLVIWSTLLVIFLKNRGNLTLEELLSYEPPNKVMAALALMGLYILKSADFIMHSGLLYAAGGIMFPLPVALMINTVGFVIVCTTPYWIGKTLGVPLVRYLLDKYPKLKGLSDMRLKNDFLVSLLFRIAGLPLTVASMYMGAMEFGFGKYLLGSVIGFFPLLLDYTILGVAADEPGSPAFLIAIGVKVLLFVGSALVYRHLAKKEQTQGMDRSS